MLNARVRNDWDYPPLPIYQQDHPREDAKRRVDQRVAGFKFADRGALEPPSDFSPAEWRERSSSDEDATSEEHAVTEGSGPRRPACTKCKLSKSSRGTRRRTSSRSGSGEEAVTQCLPRCRARRQRWQAALHEEMAWNTGLAHWLERRDLWSGAKSRAQVEMLESATRPASNDPTIEAVESDESPRSSTSSKSTTPTAAGSSSTTLDSTAAPLVTLMAIQTHTPPVDVLVPLAPPMLPNHPVRLRITPATYPEIYSKIIVTGRTPSVPINLQAVISALVQGWKDNDEWPPKQTALEDSIGRKRASRGEHSIRNSVRAVGRVLRITGNHDAVTIEKDQI